MANIEILLPAMGEGIIEATLTRILVKVGDSVNEDDAVVELATDKVDSEVPSPQQGVVAQILVQEGEVLPIGTPMLILTVSEDLALDVMPTDEIPFLADIEKITPQLAATNKPDAKLEDRLFLTPLVRSIIDTEKLTDTELKNVIGTGLDGRITKRDLLAFIAQRNAKPTTQSIESTSVNETDSSYTQTANPTPQTVIPTVRKKVMPTLGTEIIEMDRMRRFIADHMVDSVRTSPHVSSFVEVDMTRIVKWRDRVKDEFQKKYNEKLTFTPFFIEAAAKALRDFPMVNVSVDGYTIIKKNFINIGMATALPTGNLIVPVIKNADNMNLTGLARSVNDLAARARKNELKPEEVQGGTFSITNVGPFGNITGVPILNQPEVAILVVGAIQKKPAVIETPDGDTIGIRNLMIMGMSFDHRAVDGALGGMYLKRVADYLEEWDVTRGV